MDRLETGDNVPAIEKWPRKRARERNMKSMRELVMMVVMGLFLCLPAWSAEMNESELAQKAQNPVSDLISLPLQNNLNFSVGPQDETQNVLNIQPVAPFSLTGKWNLITRTIVPIIWQPEFVPGRGRTTG